MAGSGKREGMAGRGVEFLDARRNNLDFAPGFI